MKKTGFTLIELLVVIAILAGLVAILFPNFMDVRQRARDAQRKSDLKQIQKALESYKLDYSPQQYPAALPAVGTVWTGPGGNVYMQKVPGDPLGPCALGSNKYYYLLDGSDNNVYTMYACLENQSDPDKIDCNTIPAPYFQTVTGCTCNSGYCYKVTNP